MTVCLVTCICCPLQSVTALYGMKPPKWPWPDLSELQNSWTDIFTQYNDVWWQGHMWEGVKVKSTLWSVHGVLCGHVPAEAQRAQRLCQLMLPDQREANEETFFITVKQREEIYSRQHTQTWLGSIYLFHFLSCCSADFYKFHQITSLWWSRPSCATSAMCLCRAL